jgi:hypothetical protein
MAGNDKPRRSNAEGFEHVGDEEADRLRLLILVSACGAFVAVLRNHAEIALAHANRESPKSAAFPQVSCQKLRSERTGDAIRRGAGWRECGRSPGSHAVARPWIPRGGCAPRCSILDMKLSRCRRCCSPKTTMWSRHSLRIEPISLCVAVLPGRPRRYRVVPYAHLREHVG